MEVVYLGNGRSDRIHVTVTIMHLDSRYEVKVYMYSDFGTNLKSLHPVSAIIIALCIG